MFQVNQDKMASRVSQVHQEVEELLDARDLVDHQVQLDQSDRKANPDLLVVQDNRDNLVMKDTREK